MLIQEDIQLIRHIANNYGSKSPKTDESLARIVETLELLLRKTNKQFLGERI